MWEGECSLLPYNSQLDIRVRLINIVERKTKKLLWAFHGEPVSSEVSHSKDSSAMRQITLMTFRYCAFNGHFIICLFLFVFIVEVTSSENIIDVRDICFDLHHWFLNTHREADGTVSKGSIQSRILIYWLWNANQNGHHQRYEDPWLLFREFNHIDLLSGQAKKSPPRTFNIIGHEKRSNIIHFPHSFSSTLSSLWLSRREILWDCFTHF